MISQQHETGLLSEDTSQLSLAELDIVSGGRIRWIDIFMPYKDFIKWPGGEPSPTRYA